MRVARWGNSLAVRLPVAVVEALGLKDGDEVEIRVAGDGAFEVARDESRAAAMAKIKALSRPLPPGFKFDRDEANER